MNSNVKIYQIFYDEPSRQKLCPEFLPLDNTHNLRPDWYEFWIIRNFLLSHTLDENTWYAFLSPSFIEKTALSSEFVSQILRQVSHDHEVFLFSFAWDHICYFKNAWEQGETFHPGITEMSEHAFKAIGLDFKLNSFIGHLSNTVFSYYFAAKKKFWIDWLTIAGPFLHYCEDNEKFKIITKYKDGLAPMKTFIQERIPTLLLSTRDYKVAIIDPIQNAPIQNIFINNESSSLRRNFALCHHHKLEYLKTKDVKHLQAYKEIRSLIRWG